MLYMVNVESKFKNFERETTDFTIYCRNAQSKRRYSPSQRTLCPYLGSTALSYGRGGTERVGTCRVKVGVWLEVHRPRSYTIRHFLILPFDKSVLYSSVQEQVPHYNV